MAMRRGGRGSITGSKVYVCVSKKKSMVLGRFGMRSYTLGHISARSHVASIMIQILEDLTDR